MQEKERQRQQERQQRLAPGAQASEIQTSEGIDYLAAHYDAAWRQQCKL
jgi:hypothetical protein